jgi:radical SAM superfamily enzyme YgiQ (UPF0313 family)
MKKILLVNPLPLRFELTQDASFLKLPLVNSKSFMLPLHIATIAGLIPDSYEVELWDEAVHGRLDHKPDLPDYDLVGVTGYTAHLPRAQEVARLVRQHGVPVAIGGSGISTMPERFGDCFDFFFIGEAELTWPQFLADWQHGSQRKVYRQIVPVDLALSPPPRWTSIRDQMHNYYLGAVQTSRGCPFDCEFCDVSYLFGHRFRHKPIDHVLTEVSTLGKAGMTRIVFCDDNFYGNPRYTKDLLRELISLNKTFATPLAFASELSLNIANDEEALSLFADANFIELFIGIESPNKKSLKSSNKIQNIRNNLVDDIKKVQSYGMSVRGSLIVGFDDDDQDIFDQQFQFVQQACLTVPSIRVLMAPRRTRLWQRLNQEGRIVKTETEGRFFGNPGTTNIIPKQMARWELHSGYLNLIEKVHDWGNFAIRIKGFVSNIKRRHALPKQAHQWQRFFRFLLFVLTSLDKKTRGVILDILWYTLKHSPAMLPRLTGVINRQYGYAVRPKLRESILGLIELEKSGGLELEPEPDESLVPEGFKASYNEIFPEIYGQVFQGLTDKARTEETLVDIFTEFLVRWRNNPDTAAEKLNTSLTAYADYILMDKNRVSAGASPPPVNLKVAMADFDKTRLNEQILKAVEQELLIAESRCA